MTLYSDNFNVVSWLGTRRSPNPVVCSLVAAIDRIKYLYTIKLTVRYIPSGKNRTADRLSRNSIPRWLQARGSDLSPCMRDLAFAINLNNLIGLWSNSTTSAQPLG